MTLFISISMSLPVHVFLNSPLAAGEGPPWNSVTHTCRSPADSSSGWQRLPWLLAVASSEPAYWLVVKKSRSLEVHQSRTFCWIPPRRDGVDVISHQSVRVVTLDDVPRLEQKQAQVGCHELSPVTPRGGLPAGHLPRRLDRLEAGKALPGSRVELTDGLELGRYCLPVRVDGVVAVARITGVAEARFVVDVPRGDTWMAHEASYAGFNERISTLSVLGMIYTYAWRAVVERALRERIPFPVHRTRVGVLFDKPVRHIKGGKPEQNLELLIMGDITSSATSSSFESCPILIRIRLKPVSRIIS